jgi:Ca2+:H+ antiporter
MTSNATTVPAATPWWSWVLPSLAWALLALPAVARATAPAAVLDLALAAVLVGTVLAAVHHAEVVAHKLGEPYGTLVLALAVTVIEVALIVSIMISGGAAKAALARDTVFAAVIIVCNGIVGLCLLLGGARHHEQEYQVRGAAAYIAVLAALATLTLVLPNYTTTAAGPVYTRGQLVFVGLVSLALYGVFLFVQTSRHRDYFLSAAAAGHGDAHAAPPTTAATVLSGGLLLAALGAVVLLAKALAPALEAGVARVGAPPAVVGVAIAALVLLPEGLAATRAARRDRLQTALNLALGSAVASIGLTIPAVAAVSVLLGQSLVLGLEAKETVLLGLTLLLAVLTLGTTGRTTVLQGAVHLVVFAVYLFLVFVP